MSGYSEDELIGVQQLYSLRFPPDLADIYRKRRSVIPKDDFDWVRTPRAEIERMLAWPLEGMLFDIDNNGFWMQEWGEKPTKKSAQGEIARAAIAAAPKLIPIYGHRYIPEEPHAHGNPIFSVYQTDIICYGVNLAVYIRAETRGYLPTETLESPDLAPPLRRIRFWSFFIGDDE